MWRLPPRMAWLMLFLLGCAEATSDAAVADASLLGRTRAEAEAVLGRPNSALRRGDGEVLIFGDGARVELRDGRIVAVRDGSFGEIVAADGTRYVVDNRGAIRSDGEAPAIEEAREINEAGTARFPTARAGAGAPAEASVGEGESPPAIDEDLALVRAAEHPEESVFAAHPEVGRLLAAQKLSMAADEETGPQAPEASDQVEWAIGVALHLAIILVVLALSLKWIGLPYVWADLVKVGVLTLVVREAIHALGGLGGNWEMIRLFRAGECVSFFALATLLFRFKVALSGLTALKVAAATKLVSYLLMMGVGLALTFAL